MIFNRDISGMPEFSCFQMYATVFIKTLQALGLELIFLSPNIITIFFYTAISFVNHFTCINRVSKQLDGDWTAFKVTKLLICIGKSLQNVVKEFVVEIISSDPEIVVITAT